MRNSIPIVVLGALVAVTLVSALRAQEEGKESETVALRPALTDPVDSSLLWNFSFSGRKRRGEVLELEQLDHPKHSGMALVITHIEMRLQQSMRVQLTEYREDAAKKQRDGSPWWNKKVRRGPAFSAGHLDQRTEWLIADYDSLIGIVFDPGTRPTLEFTLGSGDIEIWAEGYWAKPRPAGK